MTALLRLTPVAACLLLAACSTPVPPDAGDPAVPVPPRWLQSTQPAAGSVSAPPVQLGSWWQTLGDPTLVALVDATLARNTDWRTAQAQLRQVRARRAASAAAQWPGLTGTASAGRSRASGSSSMSGRDNFGLGWNASWELDLFGGIAAGVDAAEADVRVSAAQLQATRVSLAAEAALAYVELRSLQARLQIARDNLELQTQTYQIADWRLQAGLASSLDAEQARADLAGTQAQIPALEASLAQAEHALAQLTGHTPASLREAAWWPGLKQAVALPALPADIATGVPAQVLDQRPDLIAARDQVAAEAARLRVAEAARYPSLSISATLGRQAVSLDALGSSAATTRSLLAQLTAPLFDAGRIRSQIEQQDAVLEAARLRYEATLLSALREVEDALVALRGNRQRQQSLQIAAGAAQNAALLARQQYASGLIDFQTVLVTQRAQLSAEDSLATARADGLSALVRLYKALGGGWTSMDPDAVPPAPASSLAPAVSPSPAASPSLASPT